MGTVEKLGVLLTKQGLEEIVSRKLKGRHRFFLSYNDFDKRFTFYYQSRNKVNFSQFECKGFSVIPSSTQIRCISVKGFESVFMRVMEDLYLGSKDIHSDDVERWIMKRLKRWKSFFEYHEAERMTKEIQMGLFGELQTLLKLYESGLRNAVLFWQGPERTEHDFVLPDNRYECKVISMQRNFVKIHGAPQLYSDTPLILRVYKVSLKEDGQSVHDLVELCQSVISSQHEEMFEELLGKYGYISDQVEVYKFQIEQRSDYAVKDGFPRVPIIEGIDKVEYRLNLESCEEYRIENN